MFGHTIYSDEGDKDLFLKLCRNSTKEKYINEYNEFLQDIFNEIDLTLKEYIKDFAEDTEAIKEGYLVYALFCKICTCI